MEAGRSVISRAIDATYFAGYPLDVSREFWREADKIRDKLDGPNQYEHSAIAHEQAALFIANHVNALWIDRLCGPWFDESAFQ